jgi:hypothetical protein
MNVLKNAGAILAGIIVIVILSTGTDALLAKVGVFTSLNSNEFESWMLTLALVYRIAYTLVAGYVTAAFSSTHPMRNVTVLGIIGIVASIAGTIIGWKLSSHWYPIALVITAFPGTWLGGKFRVKNLG